MINLTRSIRMEIALQTRKDIKKFFHVQLPSIWAYTRFRSLCFIIVSLIEIDTSQPISRFDSISFILGIFLEIHGLLTIWNRFCKTRYRNFRRPCRWNYNENSIDLGSTRHGTDPISSDPNRIIRLRSHGN